jgi:Tol biopolymer transport system component
MQIDIKRSAVILLCCLAVAIGCSDSDSGGDMQSRIATDLRSKTLSNQAPYLPPQCYTKTVLTNGEALNPCYTCHTRGFRPDFTNDNDLQLEYAFPDYAEENHWTNLLKDRSQAQFQISDDEILSYIRTSNYLNEEKQILLAMELASLPEGWDYDGDGSWSGYIPDCYFNFANDGFDQDPLGAYTGWRALAYYPFPATHWPSNGDYADVLIRLPEAFQMRDQVFDLETYKINLAIVEALIKKEDVNIPPTDETLYQVDLDKDGTLSTAEKIVYDWAPTEGRNMEYVGDAKLQLAKGDVHLAAGLYPEGTEFLNTLHYVDVTEGGAVTMAKRLKEIRYGRKIRWLTYADLETTAMDEIKERDDFPDRLTLPIGNMEDGVTNGIGWVFQGFIEDANGDLRPQTFEETASCIGCHGGIGATTDSTFAMARKLDSREFQNGWYHWAQKDLSGLNEPKAEFRRAGVQYEYSYYLMYARAGDEFRSNEEVIEAFFDDDGILKQEMAEKLHGDISILLYPSSERALALNKTYKQIVQEQSYAQGRSSQVATKETVFDQLTTNDLDTKVGTSLMLTAHPSESGCNPCVDLSSEPVDDEMKTVISGDGMSGPNGERYQIDASGLIDESAYSATTKGVYFPFPPRHTLPTRMIVPLGSIPTCYECHRLERPVAPDNPKVTVPVEFTAEANQEEEVELVQLTENEGNDVNGNWSPDGSRIVWESDRSGRFQLWMMNSDGSQKQAVTQGPAIHGWADWHPSGSRLVYWGYDPETGTYSIATANADGSNVDVIVESEEMLDRPSWSPDGNFLAWGAQTDGNWDIWVSDGNGDNIQRLTYDSQMESNPLWRPDGDFIAYKVAPDKEYNLTLENFLNVENGFGSPTVRVWDGIKSVQMNDWSPDGDLITYTAEIVTNASGEDRVSYLAVVEDVSMSGAKTSGSPVILSAHNTLGDRGPVFSPDGSQIAFWSWDKSYRATLWAAASDGSSLKQITRLGPDMTPQWHPDGDLLLFESARNGNMDIWTVGVE